jgi:hypothetical protein
MASIIGLCCSHFSYFFFDLKMWCRGDRSHASLVPVAHRSAVRSAIPPWLPFMVSLTASTGDLAVVILGLPRPVVALVPGVLSAGAAGI